MASVMQFASLGRRERNVNINIGSFMSTRKHSEKSRWICIYPAYLNSKKSISDGRKIPLKSAVDNPTLNEIKDVLTNAGFQVEIEPGKVYPRELNKYENLSRGRLRVQLKNDDGTPCKPEFKDTETIPKLKSRGAGNTSKSSGATSSQQTEQSKSGKKSGKKK